MFSAYSKKFCTGINMIRIPFFENVLPFTGVRKQGLNTLFNRGFGSGNYPRDHRQQKQEQTWQLSGCHPQGSNPSTRRPIDHRPVDQHLRTPRCTHVQSIDHTEFIHRRCFGIANTKDARHAFGVRICVYKNSCLKLFED
jgi:hypothetical protein